MFKKMAALWVLHDFPELLYFRVGRQGSITELLEENFSCFMLLVHLMESRWMGGAHGMLAWWLGLRRGLGSLSGVVGATSHELSTEQLSELYTWIYISLSVFSASCRCSPSHSGCSAGGPGGPWLADSLTASPPVFAIVMTRARIRIKMQEFT